MIVRTKLTQSEFVSANWLSLRTRPLASRMALAVFPALSILLICAACLKIYFGQTLGEQWYLICESVAVMCFPLILSPYLFRRAYRKVPLLAEERIFEFDEAGMHISGSVYNSRTEWGLFTKFAENKDVFIIYQQGDQIFFPCPKRHCLQTPSARFEWC